MFSCNLCNWAVATQINATYWFGLCHTTISNALFYISNQPAVYVYVYNVQVCFTKSFTAWMNVGEKKEDDGRSGLQCFCFGWGHNWSGESWEALIWTQPLQSATQYKSWRTGKYSVACISVEVVWVDLAGAWFYGKRRHGVTSQSHPKTHHILHFVSTVTRSRLFYIS